MKRGSMVGLVSCVAGKQATACAARDLYTSPLFRMSRRLAELVCSEWGILSAKHGLVMPDDVIEPYNETLNRMPVDQRRLWAVKTRRALVRRWPGRRFMILAGLRYATALSGLRTYDPLYNLPIGKRLQRLKQLLEEGASL